MQGQGDFGMIVFATLKNWDITSKLKTLKIPILVIGAQYDTKVLKQME